MAEVVGSNYGLGGDGQTGAFLFEMVEAVDPAVDFSQFDNDGPDGIANSGDDDGYRPGGGTATVAGDALHPGRDLPRPVAVCPARPGADRPHAVRQDRLRLGVVTTTLDSTSQIV